MTRNLKSFRKKVLRLLNKKNHPSDILNMEGPNGSLLLMDTSEDYAAVIFNAIPRSKYTRRAYQVNFGAFKSVKNHPFR